MSYEDLGVSKQTGKYSNKNEIDARRPTRLRHITTLATIANLHHVNFLHVNLLHVNLLRSASSGTQSSATRAKIALLLAAAAAAAVILIVSGTGTLKQRLVCIGKIRDKRIPDGPRARLTALKPRRCGAALRG
jgi:hypothetical protein